MAAAVFWGEQRRGREAGGEQGDPEEEVAKITMVKRGAARGWLGRNESPVSQTQIPFKVACLTPAWAVRLMAAGPAWAVFSEQKSRAATSCHLQPGPRWATNAACPPCYIWHTHHTDIYPTHKTHAPYTPHTNTPHKPHTTPTPTHHTDTSHTAYTQHPHTVLHTYHIYTLHITLTPHTNTPCIPTHHTLNYHISTHKYTHEHDTYYTYHRSRILHR